jgi:hypothetical protein
MDKFSLDSFTGGAKKIIKKAPVIATTAALLGGSIAEGQILNANEIMTKEGAVIHLEKCSIQSMENNGDMPTGFKRYLWGEQDASGKHFNSYASVFYLDKAQTKTTLVTKEDYPSMYNGAATNFQETNNVARMQGMEGVLFFSGPYKASNGAIEGAYAVDGNLNTSTPAPYGGVLYIDKDGKPEVINCRDANGKLDQNKLVDVENRAVRDQGTFFQQKMIITEGQQSKNFDPKSPTKFEWRLMAETNDGKTIVINGTAKVTLAEELRMLLSMKDPSGLPLIKNCILFDTGALSEGKFRTKTQIAHDASNNTFTGYTIRDESFGEEPHVATVVIGSISTQAAITPNPTTNPIRVTQPVRDSVPAERPYTPPSPAPVYQKQYQQQQPQNSHPLINTQHPDQPSGNYQSYPPQQ